MWQVFSPDHVVLFFEARSQRGLLVVIKLYFKMIGMHLMYLVEGYSWILFPRVYGIDPINLYPCIAHVNITLLSPSAMPCSDWKLMDAFYWYALSFSVKAVTPHPLTPLLSRSCSLYKDSLTENHIGGVICLSALWARYQSSKLYIPVIDGHITWRPRLKA